MVLLRAFVQTMHACHLWLLPAASQPAQPEADQTTGKRPRAGRDHHGAQRTPSDSQGSRGGGILCRVLTADNNASPLSYGLVERVESRSQPLRVTTAPIQNMSAGAGDVAGVADAL